MAFQPAKTAVLDDIDRDILSELTRDGRLSFTDLAARVKLSANAVADRVRRLERTGIIRGYAAELDRRVLGMGLEAYIDVKLRADTPADRFEAAIERIPGVVQMILTTGSSDYTIRVACSDQADLVRLVESLRAAVPIAETYSRLILRERNLSLTPQGRSARRGAGTSG
jgi:Lrp/AsnC family transcriptional regulator, leucine-responsive regulatory protein